MQERKEILYVGGFELPDKNAAAQRVIANGKILMELGYEVYYLGLDRTINKNYLKSQQPDTFEGFQFFRVKYPLKLSEWILYLFSIRSIIKLINRLPNLHFVIAYNYPAPALFRLKRLCLKRNIKLIADCTEWYEPHGGLIFKAIKGFDTYLRMKVIHPKLNGVIAISRFLYEFYFARMANVIQVPPLVDLSAVKWENTIKQNSEELVLVYAGSPGMGTKDRIDTILKALSTIKAISTAEFSLHVIGLTKQQYIDCFGSAYLTPGLESSIVFMGRLSHIDTLWEVKGADYAIFIRDKNLVNTAGFPTKFVEAFSCGTAVLTNLSSNVSDYLKDGVNGYVLDNSTEENFVKTLGLALSQTKKKIDEMRFAIKSEDTFDYRKYIEHFRQFLDGIKGNDNGN